MSIINVSPTCVGSGSHNMGIRVLPKLMALSFSFSALQDMWDFENRTYLSIWKKSHGQRPLKSQNSLSKLTWLHVGSNKVLGSCSKIPLRGLETFYYPKLLFFPTWNIPMSCSHPSFPVQCSFFPFFAVTVSKSVFREQTWCLGPPYLLLHLWLWFTPVMEINDISCHRIGAPRLVDGKFVPLLALSLARL